MKMKIQNQVSKPDSFFENVVEKKFDSANSRFMGDRLRLDDKEFSQALFDNLPELIRAQVLAKVLSVSVLTVYDWRYRSRERNIPENMFVKINRNLFIRTSVFKNWIASQNPSL
jgi:hypothetical protein